MLTFRASAPEEPLGPSTCPEIWEPDKPVFERRNVCVAPFGRRDLDSE